MVGLFTAAGFLGRFAWWLDLAVHFRVQYCAVSAGLLVCFLLGRWWRRVVFSLACVCANAVPILPLYTGGGEAAGTTDHSYRAMLINVNTHLGDPDAVARSIERHAPDVVVLEEVNLAWLKRLSLLMSAYPYRTLRPRDDNFGIAMFSRRPFERANIESMGIAGVPTVYGIIRWEGRALTIVGTHPVPPVNAACSAARDDQLACLPAFLRRFDGPVLLLGDLNTTPWSHAFRTLVADSGLRDSTLGFGLQPTWPTFSRCLRIPLDHCLHSADVAICNRFVGENVGSDHYPLIVDVRLRP